MIHSYSKDDFKQTLQNSMQLLQTGSGEDKVRGLENIVSVLKSLNRDFLIQYRTNYGKILKQEFENQNEIQNNLNNNLNNTKIDVNTDTVQNDNLNLNNEHLTNIISNENIANNLIDNNELMKDTIEIDTINDNKNDIKRDINEKDDSSESQLISDLHTPPSGVSVLQISPDTPPILSEQKKSRNVSFSEGYDIEIYPPSLEYKNPFENNLVSIKENFKKDWKSQRYLEITQLVDDKGLDLIKYIEKDEELKIQERRDQINNIKISIDENSPRQSFINQEVSPNNTQLEFSKSSSISPKKIVFDRNSYGSSGSIKNEEGMDGTTQQRSTLTLISGTNSDPILDIKLKKFRIEQQLQQEYITSYWNKTNDVFVHLIRSTRNLLVHRSSYIRAAAARVFKYLILLGLDEECWKFGVDSLLFRMFDMQSKEKDQALYIAYSLSEPHINYFPTPIIKGLINVCLNPTDRNRTKALEILFQLILVHPKVAFIFPNIMKIIVYTATIWSNLSDQQNSGDKSPSASNNANGEINLEAGLANDNLERQRSTSNSTKPALSVQMRENACQTLVHVLDHYYYLSLKNKEISTERIQAFTHSIDSIVHPFLDHLSWPNRTSQELIQIWKQSYETLIHLSMHWSGVFYIGTNLFGPLFQSILLTPSEPYQNINRRTYSVEEQNKIKSQYIELNNKRIDIILDIILGILRVACPKYLVSSLIPDSLSVNQFGNFAGEDQFATSNHEIFGDNSSRSIFNPTPHRKDIINQYMALVLRAMIRNYILEILYESGKTFKRSNAVLQVIVSLIDTFLGSQVTIDLIKGFDQEYAKVLSFQMEDLTTFVPLRIIKEIYSQKDTYKESDSLLNRSLDHSFNNIDLEFDEDLWMSPKLSNQVEKVNPLSEALSQYNISSGQRKLYALLGEIMKQDRLDYNLSPYFKTSRSRFANLYFQSYKRKNICVGNIGTNSIDSVTLSHLIKESQVPNKDVKKWEWDIIMELMRYRLVDQEKFLKRILTFFRPKKKIFCTLAFKDSHMKYCEVGCQLLRYVILAWNPGDMNKEAFLPQQLNPNISMIPNTLSQLLNEIIDIINESSEDVIATTMTRTYFDMIGVLSQYPQGITLLKEHKMFNHLKSWVEGQRHDIAQLCLKNLNFKFKDSPSREILVNALNSKTNKTRYFATLRLKSLIQTIDDFNSWAIPLLYERTQDQWLEVTKNALRILHEACVFDSKNFDAFLALKPSIDNLICYDEKGSIQQQSLQLIYLILRQEKGLEYVQENSPNFIENELNRWESYQAVIFVQQLEQIISRTIKSNMNKNSIFIRSHMRVTGSSSVLPNIYASLVRTIKGSEIVKASYHVHNFIDRVVHLRDQLLYSNESSLYIVDIFVRTSLWMLAFIGQHDIGMNMLLSINQDILNIILQLAEESPFSSVRGIMLYCISLFCRGSVAREYFRSKSWIVDERAFTSLPRDDGKIFDMNPPEGRFHVQHLNAYTFYNEGKEKHTQETIERTYNDDWTCENGRKLESLRNRLKIESEDSYNILEIVLKAANPLFQKECLEKLVKLKDDNLFVFKDPRLYICVYLALGILSYSSTARNTLHHKIFEGWNVSGLGFDWFDETVLELEII